MPHRKRGLAAESMRGCLAFLIVILAALLSLASGPYWDAGIAEVGRTPDGTLGAHTDLTGNIPYESFDGGFTWVWRQSWEGIWAGTWSGPYGEPVPLVGQSWPEREVRTPSGDYFIMEYPHILRVDGASGSQEVVYSFAYLQNGGNRWMHSLDKRDIFKGIPLHTVLDLFYDDQSGNLIAAMGLQGVVVIAPDGTATRVAVSYYSPTDFSLDNKVRTLVGSLLHGWSAVNTGLAFLLTFSFATLTLAFPTAGATARAVLVIAAGTSAFLATTVGVYPLALQDWWGIRDPWELYIHEYAWRPLVVSGFGLLPFLLAVVGLMFAKASRKQLRAIAAAWLGMLPLLGLGALVLFQAGPTLANVVAVGLVALASFALLQHRMRAHNQGQPASLQAAV